MKHNQAAVPFILSAVLVLGSGCAWADYQTSVSTSTQSGEVTVNVEVNAPARVYPGSSYPPPPADYRGGDLPPPPDYRYAPAADYDRRPDPSYCDYFARRESDRYASSGNRPLAGAARGALGGAAFGALVGNKKNARRGAVIGATLGLVANGARNERERDYAYTRAYDDCMRNFRR